MPNTNHKRTFLNIRKRILISLSKGQKTINQLATETDINWKTVSNHLIYLLGRGHVKEVLSTPYVRIFEITDFGKEYLNSTSKENIRVKAVKLPIRIEMA